MGIAISEDHLALEETVRKFVTARCPASVPRAVLETPAEAMPPFWEELASLGWLGLHLPEAVGGQGYGMPEAAVVLEGLGWAGAPGPVLPTIWASSVIAAGGGPASVVATLASGSSVGAVAVDGLALCGAIADVIVARVGDSWVVAGPGEFTATEVPSLDPTRRLARVTISGGTALELDPAAVASVGAVLFAAESAGGAAWCVETAAEYAKVREQFGRPIGQFQAVKHKCADMLVGVEQARGVAWDAAAAWSSPDGPLAAAVAGAIAPDVFAKVAKDCIQVLGGIGFTWEHDAHMYLRRAMAVRQLVGGTSTWRGKVASLALDGARRALQLELPESAEQIRSEVRAFAESIAGLDRDDQRRRVVDGGYFVPHWAPPWGRSAGAVEQLVIDEEFKHGRIRRPNLAVGAWAAPTIAAHGTPEQQERWVRPTLLGTISWCQLFSEPGAGSDLAALTTVASRGDGGWIVNGQKVWTSMAREADWGICLVRTNKAAAKHLGITYLIVDMKSPGIEIRPLRELTGHAMFNEVFFTDLFVPDDCVVGEVDGGWPLARTTLANERVAMGSGSSFGFGVEALLGLVSEGALGGDPVVLDQVGALVAEAQSVALLGLRTTARSLTGAKPGPEASVRKLLGVEHDQRTQELGLVLLGAEAATTEGSAAQWTFGFLANRCLTIAGGTSEVQRNVIAERLLGLPEIRRDCETVPMVQDIVDPRRQEPAFVLSERDMLERWLEFHRTTLLLKTEGLDDDARKSRPVATSLLSLHGLLRHMAEVERNWFLRVLLDEPDAPPIWYDPAVEDSELVPLDDASWEADVAAWQAECDASRLAAASRSLEETGQRRGQPCSLRWIYVHMIEEYARHNGHADLLRELVDGQVGW